jgi:hypothetical protein
METKQKGYRFWESYKIEERLFKEDKKVISQIKGEAILKVV